jgi:hypothetical protein
VRTRREAVAVRKALEPGIHDEVETADTATLAGAATTSS